jgi:GNAT superfamily N-acetyltransferase
MCIVRLTNGLALQMKTPRTLDLLSWIIPGRNPLSPVGRRLILSLMVLATLDFFTQEDYRWRGFGTIIAAATLEHGFKNGLTQVNWTCDADNQGSLRIARKLGLEQNAIFWVVLERCYIGVI